MAFHFLRHSESIAFRKWCWQRPALTAFPVSLSNTLDFCLFDSELAYLLDAVPAQRGQPLLLQIPPERLAEELAFGPDKVADMGGGPAFHSTMVEV